MKFEKNSKYFSIAVYTVFTVLTIIVSTFFLFRLQIIGGYLAYVLGTCFQLLKPLLFGLILAYLFEPIVALYERKCIGLRWPFRKKKVEGVDTACERKRIAPIVFAIFTFFAFCSLILLIIMVNVQEVMGALQDVRISEALRGYVQSFQQMVESVDEATSRIPFITGDMGIVSKLYEIIEVGIKSIGSKLVVILRNLGEQLISIGLGIVIALYLLNDKKKLMIIARRLINLFLPNRIRNEVIDIVRDIDYVFSGYIRGQIIDALIMGTLISITLTCIGIDFAIIIGIISGIFNLIPYFGPVVGFVLAGFIGFIGPEPQKGLYAIIAVIVLQQLDGWLIVPKVMGETVKLHPIVVLLSIIIGGQLFGLIGFLLGVPVAGFIRLCIIRYMGDLFSSDES